MYAAVSMRKHAGKKGCDAPAGRAAPNTALRRRAAAPPRFARRDEPSVRAPAAAVVSVGGERLPSGRRGAGGAREAVTARAPRWDTPRRAAATHTRTHTRAARLTTPERAGIEDLREKREAVNTAILKEEEEKAKIQKDLSILTDRLSKINEALARRVMARNEYDKTIQETEAAYMKILESSQTLLHVLKRETVNLTKKKQYSS